MRARYNFQRREEKRREEKREGTHFSPPVKGNVVIFFKPICRFSS